MHAGSFQKLDLIVVFQALRDVLERILSNRADNDAKTNSSFSSSVAVTRALRRD